MSQPSPAEPVGVVTRLHPSAVTADLSIQCRDEKTDPERVDLLFSVLAGGGEFDEAPVLYEEPDGKLWLGGGFNRHAAAVRFDLPIPYEVRPGTREDAEEFAEQDNQQHKGMPRSNKDKRGAVLSVCRRIGRGSQRAAARFVDPQTGKPKVREIARHCGTDASWTSSVIREFFGHDADPKKSDAGRKGNDARGIATKPPGAVRPHPETPTREDGREKEEGETAPADPGWGGKRVDAGAAPAGEPDAGVVPVRPGHPERVQGGEKAAAGVTSVPRDRLGRPLPERLLRVFEDGGKIGEAARLVRSARGKAVNTDKLDTVGGLLRRNPGLLPAADALADGLAREQPYCVCPGCDGSGDGEKCPTCGGCGWLTHPEYAALPPAHQDHAASFAPGDSWEGDPDPVPPKGPAPAFTPKGPGLDALGKRIPDKLRDVFADSFLPATAVELERIAGAVESVRAWNPYLDPIGDQLRDFADHLRGCRAYAVCGCRGKGCPGCQTAGFVPVSQKHANDLKRAA